MDYSKTSITRKRVEKAVDQERLIAKVWLNVLRVIGIALLAGIFVVAGLLLGAFKGIIDSAPLQESYEITDFSSELLNSEGEQVNLIRTSVMRSEITLDKISTAMQHAVVAIEDSRFYEHNGIDIEGILRSGVEIISSGDIQGGSTITQQVVKNLALSSDTALTRKFQEWYMALQYEYELTQNYGRDVAKNKILETYLNFVNFGNGQYGVQSASHYYFKKDAAQLNVAESAVLAGVLNAPSYYDPVYEQVSCRRRQLLVLKAMLDQGFINETQYESARNDNVFARITENTRSSGEDETSHTFYTYYEEAAISQVLDDLQSILGWSEQRATQMVYHGGISIQMVQNEEYQGYIDQSVENLEDDFKHYYQVNYALSIYNEDFTDYENFGMYNLLYYTKEDAMDDVEAYRAEKLGLYGLTEEDTDRYQEDITFTVEPQLSIVLMDPFTGYVLGMSAGRGEKTVDFALNRATDAARQAGSTFKVIAAFAPAVDGAGRTGATPYDDVPLDPTETGGYSPKNWWGNDYFGFCTIRMGISNSMNLIAVRCLMDIGPDLGYEYATEHFGITTMVESDINSAMALGGLTNGVTNLELSTAYCTIANSGIYTKYTFYSKVYDHEGNLLLDKSPNGKDVVKNENALTEQSAWIVQDMMRSTTGWRWGHETASGLSLPHGIPVACKTGTSNENKDLWICAFSPYYLCTVWEGFDMMSYSQDYNSISGYRREDDWRFTLWRGVMNPIHENLEYMNFEDAPEGVVSRTICIRSGKLAGAECTDTYLEYFTRDTVPTSYCDAHQTIEVCKETGLLPCPDGSCITEKRTGTKRDYDLKRLEEILARYMPSLGFEAAKVHDYIPMPTEVCEGHDERRPQESVPEESSEEIGGGTEETGDGGGGEDHTGN